MKKILLILALATGAVAITTQTVQAQPGVSCNIGMQPMWGPTGYDYADYYYMPDIDAYYSINSNQFIYQQGGQWGYYNSLPYQYRNYDLYNGYKVVINGRNPWARHSYYRDHYYGYRGRRNQAFIRDSRDYRYFQNPNHPYHNQWRGDNYGNSYGRGRYNDGYNGRGGYGGRRGDGYRQDNRGGYDNRGNNGNWGSRGGERTEGRGGYDRGGNDNRGNNGSWGSRGGERTDGRGGNDRGGWDNRGGGDHQNGGGNDGGGWRGGRR